jgi:hypothetical protein
MRIKVSKSLPEKVKIEDDKIYTQNRDWPRAIIVVIAIRLGL